MGATLWPFSMDKPNFSEFSFLQALVEGKDNLRTSLLLTSPAE
jgi:hypothetical protein